MSRLIVTRSTSAFRPFPLRSRDTSIILLAFAAASPSIMRKYAEIYERNGFNTVIYMAHFLHGNPLSLKYSKMATALARCLRDELSDPSRSVAVQTFSMNGVMTLSSLLLQYPELNLLNRTRGILFDSGPVYFNKMDAGKYLSMADAAATKYIESPNPLHRGGYQALKSLIYTWNQMLHLKPVLYRKLGLDLNSVSSFHYLLNRVELPKNLSFVYSHHDTVCPASVIEEFISEVKSRNGHNVDALHCDGAEHVAHLRKYPDQYKNLVERFLSSLETSGDEAFGNCERKILLK